MGSQWRETRWCISLCELLTQLNTHMQKRNGNDVRKKNRKKEQILLCITEKNNAQQKAFHKVMPTEWMVHFTLPCYCCRRCSFVSRNMGFCSVSFVIVLKTENKMRLCSLCQNCAWSQRMWDFGQFLSKSLKTGHSLKTARSQIRRWIHFQNPNT